MGCQSSHSVRDTVRESPVRLSAVETLSLESHSTILMTESTKADGIEQASVEDTFSRQWTPMSLDLEPARPTIVLIAHDSMKKVMRRFVKVHADMLGDFQLSGPGTTCAMLREEGLECINSMAGGDPDGEQQIGTMITTGQTSAVFFFQDPSLVSLRTASDVDTLSKLANCYQVCYGRNYQTASALLSIMHLNLNKCMASRFAL